jgi:DNA-directed RNA polymerase specialized sigma24 family protein
MGAKPLELPSFFTKEWYEEQKKLGHTDVKLACEMYVCQSTFKRWKKILGIQTTNRTRLKSSLKPLLYGKGELVKTMYLAGATYVAIGKKLGVSKETVRKELRKMGIEPKERVKWVASRVR